MRRNHNNSIAGHCAAKRTLELVAHKYLWLGMKRDVAQYMDTCMVWTQSKSCTHKLYRELQFLPTPTESWVDISFDFIVGLLRSRRTLESKEKNAILAIVDRFTKIVMYFAVTDKIDAPSLKEVLAQKLVLKGAGFLESIVSDRGPQLISKFWSAFSSCLRIQRHMSSAYHPQTDGQTEQ